MRDKPHMKHKANKGNDNNPSKKETSGKRKVDKSRLTGQHEAELKQGKDGWDVTLNMPTGDDRVGIMASTKPRGCIEPTVMVH
jgi:hypothetical protein